MFEHDFLVPFPYIFLINATIILLIYGVLLSTSKKNDYPPLVRNVSWLGLLSDAFVEQGGEHSKKIKAVYQTMPLALFELTFSSCSRDMYLLRRVFTFHLTNNGEVGGPPIFKILDQNFS
jgi:NADH-ubiquinone oxidoreductase chain 2